MLHRFDIKHFAGSRTGRGYLTFILFCALFSFGIGYAFYQANLHFYTVSKREEKITALQLVDAFVNQYSDIRNELHSEDRRCRPPSAPMPSSSSTAPATAITCSASTSSAGPDAPS